MFHNDCIVAPIIDLIDLSSMVCVTLQRESCPWEPFICTLLNAVARDLAMRGPSAIYKKTVVT